MEKYKKLNLNNYSVIALSSLCFRNRKCFFLMTNSMFLSECNIVPLAFWIGASEVL